MMPASVVNPRLNLGDDQGSGEAQSGSTEGTAVFGFALVVLVALSWLAFATATPTEFQALPYFFVTLFTILVAAIGLAVDSGWRSGN
jgi:hypothetical protein